MPLRPWFRLGQDTKGGRRPYGAEQSSALGGVGVGECSNDSARHEGRRTLMGHLAAASIVEGSL